MTSIQIVGLVTGAITIIGTIVAIAVYMTKLQAQVQQGKLESSLDTMKTKFEAMEAKNSELNSRLKQTVVAGSYLAGKKQAIDLELALLTDALHATSSSVLVPVPSEIANEQAKELVFLTLLGAGSEKLTGLRVPMESIGGNVYTTGKARIIHKPREESEVSAKTDEVSKTKSSEMLALPLVYQGQCIGVIEFLNKVEGKQFDETDQEHAERSITSISAKVGEFIKDPNSFQMLGITPRKKAVQAAILFSDLSRSSLLIKRLDASTVVDILDQYFETLCSIAIAHGGRIDKFIGDGFMITFNVQYPIADPELRATTAAMEMNKQFAELKTKWDVFNAPEIHNRIAIESGPVHKVEIGHSQARQLTVMGDAVNTASNLCQVAKRDHNIVVVGESAYHKVSSKFKGTKMEIDNSNRPDGASLSGYELMSEN